MRLFYRETWLTGSHVCFGKLLQRLVKGEEIYSLAFPEGETAQWEQRLPCTYEALSADLRTRVKPV